MHRIEYIVARDPRRTMKHIGQVVQEAMAPHLTRVEIHLVRGSGIDLDELRSRLSMAFAGHAFRLLVSEGGLDLTDASAHVIEFTYANIKLERENSPGGLLSRFLIRWTMARSESLERKRVSALNQALMKLAQEFETDAIEPPVRLCLVSDIDTATWLEPRKHRALSLLAHFLPKTSTQAWCVGVEVGQFGKSPTITARLTGGDEAPLVLPVWKSEPDTEAEAEFPAIELPDRAISLQPIPSSMLPTDSTDSSPTIFSGLTACPEPKEDVAMRAISCAIKARSHGALLRSITTALNRALKPGVRPIKLSLALVNQPGLDSDDIKQALYQYLSVRSMNLGLRVDLNPNLDTHRADHLLRLYYDEAGERPRFESPSMSEQLGALKISTVKKLNAFARLFHRFSRSAREESQLCAMYKNAVLKAHSGLEVFQDSGKILSRVTVATTLGKMHSWLRNYPDEARQILIHQLGLDPEVALEPVYKGGSIAPGDPLLEFVFSDHR